MEADHNFEPGPYGKCKRCGKEGGIHGKLNASMTHTDRDSVERLCHALQADGTLPRGEIDETLRALLTRIETAEAAEEGYEQIVAQLKRELAAANERADKAEARLREADPMALLRNEMTKAAHEAEEEEQKLYGGRKDNQ